MKAQFNEEEQIALTLLVGIINSFNRIGVGFHVPPVRAAAQGCLMAAPSAQDPAAIFDPLRPTLDRAIAYRMLGSVADAEDVVQDAFLRWMATDRAAVRQPEASCAASVTRLCLDQLKSARRRREVYPGHGCPSRWSKPRRTRPTTSRCR